SASRLYGFDTQDGGNGAFRRMAVDASGVSTLDVTWLPLGPDIRFADGRIYGASGAVLDPDARRLLGSFPDVRRGSFSSLVLPDGSLPRVFFLTDAPNIFPQSHKLLAFDPNSFLPLGSLDLSTINSPVSSLIRWGQ